LRKPANCAVSGWRLRFLLKCDGWNHPQGEAGQSTREERKWMTPISEHHFPVPGDIS
jgi:hypothetical protein